MKVLVVDDEELIRNIIVEYCHNEGYLTDEACVRGNRKSKK